MDDAPTVPDLTYLQQRSSDELRSMQRFLHSQIEGYAHVLHIGTPVLDERRA